jgi:hypothetical protein
MKLRLELPQPMPAAIAQLPRHRGYPVPWFVAWLTEDGQATRRGTGTPDFRVLYPDAITTALGKGLCWVCGKPLHRNVAYAFVIGPMCAVNRTSSEPPSHIVCADWSARACPFLTKPHMDRREGGLPEEGEVSGIALLRNPGIAMVWLTRNASAFPDPISGKGLLFNVGDPVQVRFYREGREATRDEILDSIESGLPLLKKYAEQDGPEAMAQLELQVDTAMKLLPVAA